MLYTDLGSLFFIQTASILQQTKGVVGGEGRQRAPQFRRKQARVHLLMKGRHVRAKKVYLRGSSQNCDTAAKRDIPWPRVFSGFLVPLHTAIITCDHGIGTVETHVPNASGIYIRFGHFNTVFTVIAVRGMLTGLETAKQLHTATYTSPRDILHIHMYTLHKRKS